MVVFLSSLRLTTRHLHCSQLMICSWVDYLYLTAAVRRRMPTFAARRSVICTTQRRWLAPRALIGRRHVTCRCTHAVMRNGRGQWARRCGCPVYKTTQHVELYQTHAHEARCIVSTSAFHFSVLKFYFLRRLLTFLSVFSDNDNHFIWLTRSCLCETMCMLCTVSNKLVQQWKDLTVSVHLCCTDPCSQWPTMTHGWLPKAWA